MGYNELLRDIRQLTRLERQSLLIEAAMVDNPIVGHGLTDQQWLAVKIIE